MDLPSGVVTFLFTDIEGSTRLLYRLGDRYADALRDHRRVVREAVVEHDGVEVDTQGDAFFVVFPRASDAVSAALEIQRKLAEGPVRLRIGLHTGEPITTPEGYVGLDVHRGARIASAGCGGQVLLSSATQQLIDADVRDLGVHWLKDLVDPEHIFQLGEAEFPPIKSLNQSNLPVPSTPFVGREREVREIVATLRTGNARALTLTGPGGSGKTRLALQAAAEMVDDFPDGVWFVELAALRDANFLPAMIAQSLGVREVAGETIDETLTRHFSGKKILLVLDNLEQLLPAGAPRIAALGGAASGLRLLVTSREPLHISPEREYPVHPFMLSEAVAVFGDRAQAVQPDFRVSDDNRLAVEAICARLDQLPLAIELAAARVKTLPVDRLLERLERRLPLLVGGARDAPDRQHTLRATIAWSHDLLDGPEQTLFARLAVFVGGCDLDAVEAVCDADFETLSSLIDKNLVRLDERVAGGRYLMLETVREFALENLDRRGDSDETRRRHAAFFLALAERSVEELTGLVQEQRLRELEIDHDNLRNALRRLLDHDPAASVRMAGSLWMFWYVHGHITEGRRWLARALERAPAITVAQAVALDGAGYLAGEQADPAARTLLEESLRSARAVSSPTIAAMAASHLSVRVMDGDPERSRALGTEAVTLAREAGDRYTLAVALNNRGEVERALGATELATKLYEEAYIIRREIGDFSRVALSLVNLGEMAFLARDLGRARSLLSEGLDVARKMGDKRQTSFAVSDLGWVALAEGDVEEAETCLREGLALARELGHKQQGVEAIKGLAGTAAAGEDWIRAARLGGAAVVLEVTVGEALTSVAESGIHSRLLDGARTRADQEAWDAAWAEGAAMDLSSAVDYALSDR